MKLLMLDLDGTVRRPISDPNGFINAPMDQERIPGAYEALLGFQKAGWKMVGVSNQMGVLHGYKSLGDCIAEQAQTIRLFPMIRKVFFCPDAGESLDSVLLSFTGEPLWRIEAVELRPGYNKGFRKPQPGMLNFAREWADRVVPGPVENWLMVGDREDDRQAAVAANCPFMDAKELLEIDWLDPFWPDQLARTTSVG